MNQYNVTINGKSVTVFAENFNLALERALAITIWQRTIDHGIISDVSLKLVHMNVDNQRHNGYSL